MAMFFKYFGWLVGLLAFVWLAMTSVTEFIVRSAVDAPYDEKLVELSRALADEIRPTSSGVIIRPGAIQLLRSDRRDRVYFALRDASGQVLEGDPEMPQFPAARTRETIQEGAIGDVPVRVASLQIPDPRNPQAQLTVQVAETLNKRRTLVESLKTPSVLLPQVVVMLGAILIVLYGFAYVVGPMRRLMESIDQRGSSDLTPLDPDAAPRELRYLIESINGLMARLSGSIEAQGRFIADAAHQLRTPLAGLKSQTELALAEHDPERMRHALDHIAAGTERCTALANRLLTLARAESYVPNQEATVDLVTLAKDGIADHLPAANARGQDLGFDGPHHGILAAVHGDELLLRELLSNLVDNAIRYTPDGGIITVDVQPRDDGGVRLAVTDTGPGVPADERERVFEPFYRGKDTVSVGTGLGLAIVRTIATAHRAAIGLAAGPDGRGLCIAISFPPRSQ
ncbi:MAG TPA: sensor histidine kinase N-terminal domain-containing protein [Casimicrobiaceae bacterium]|nr:sensor histidine kinase N-terminal domain-containing protein [Casimicrobiaceae bacterium]